MESLDEIAGEFPDIADEVTDKTVIPLLPQIIDLHDSQDPDDGVKTTLDRGVLKMKTSMSQQRDHAK